MFRFILTFYKEEGLNFELFPLTNWNPINWVKLLFGKFKTFEEFKAVSFVGKYIQDVGEKYTLFQSVYNDNIWLVSNNKHLCLVKSYDNGYIKRVILYIGHENNADLIRTCKKYAFKHNFRLDVEVGIMTTTIKFIGVCHGGYVHANIHDVLK